MNVPAGGPVPAALARRIKLVVFDVDGVLTDAGVYLGRLPGGDAIELKRFDIQDGLGLKFLQWAGLHVVIVSGRVSSATEARAAELGIECYQNDSAHKLPAIRQVMERLGIAWEEVAMLADDIPDVAALRLVGLKAAVANAVPQVAAMADWRTTREGGHGAAREFCDALLAARGELDRVVEAYVVERSRP
jgi:3-deoxy-D-manno-octulosonate 8-phosphate phosphatase (KDO 8-P phosphatase)